MELNFNSVPLSLQRAYYLLLNNTGVSLDHYRVFSHLSVLGYKVLRHSAKNVLTKYEKNIDVHKIGIKHRDIKGEHQKTMNWEPTRNEIENERIFPIHYEADDAKETILERLQAIGPRLDDSKNNEMDFSVDFDVFLSAPEKPQFRKSTIQLPDFRIRVFS